VPWFWSDQYALKLQIAGVPFESDRLVLRGETGATRFALFHLQQGRVVAVEAVNAPPEFMAGKLLIEKGTPVDPDRLADTAIPMKEILGDTDILQMRLSRSTA
jgi:3-phenylpropionate/trans-cinnamate dioxygenase ferredoxin reductase subunit